MISAAAFGNAVIDFKRTSGPYAPYGSGGSRSARRARRRRVRSLLAPRIGAGILVWKP